MSSEAGSPGSAAVRSSAQTQAVFGGISGEVSLSEKSRRKEYVFGHLIFIERGVRVCAYVWGGECERREERRERRVEMEGCVPGGET